SLQHPGAVPRLSDSARDWWRMEMKRALTALSMTLAVAAGLAAADPQAGVDQYLTGRYAEAEKSLREAVAAKPDDERSRLFLTMTLAEEQKLDQAKAEYEALVAKGAAPVTSKVAEARLAIAGKDTQKALSLLNEAAEADPEHAQ